MARMRELLPDPSFDDPSKWSIVTDTGSASVSGGVFSCVDWAGTLKSQTNHTLKLGESVFWKAMVDSLGPSSVEGIRYGAALYQQLPPGGLPGENSGVFVVDDLSVDELEIRVDFGITTMVVSSVSLYQPRPNPNWDATVQARHKKYHEQQQLEQHRKNEKIVKDLINEERIIRYL